MSFLECTKMSYKRLQGVMLFIIINADVRCSTLVRQLMRSPKGLIKQDIAVKLNSGNVRTRHIKRCNSATTKQLKEHRDCLPRADEIFANRFRILAPARNTLHLDVLDAVFVRAMYSELCQQKE